MAEIKMDAAREVAIMEGAIALYGVEAQVNVAIEEMAELTKALLKLRRAESDTARDVADIEEAKLVRLKNRLNDTFDRVMRLGAPEV